VPPFHNDSFSLFEIISSVPRPPRRDKAGREKERNHLINQVSFCIGQKTISSRHQIKTAFGALK
jgi:hypothetical protein